jgi:hypothetical protein
MVMPPLAFVIPVPLSVPPDHVSSPVTVRVSVPVNVPALWVSVLTETALPVEKFSVPAVIVSGPVAVTVAGEVKFTIAPLPVVPPVMSYVPV